MNFRDAYQDDLKTAFFDLDGFASEHTIDDVPMVVVMERTDFANAKLSYGLMKNVLNPKETAINKECIILHINDSDMVRKKYTANARIRLDGEDMFIYDVKRMEGMHRLVVGKHRV